MSEEYINLTLDNLEEEHLCCAIADKKHQAGVVSKKEWLKERISEGHVFRKLNAKGKIFVEYAPLEEAWVPIEGEDYVYIYCLWVSGSYKGKGHAKALLTHCIEDAKAQGKKGVCILSSQKKKPFLSDKKFMQKFGFEVADTFEKDYELLALPFDGSKPAFAECVKHPSTTDDTLTIYYSPQCPYSADCIAQVKAFCEANAVALNLVVIDSLKKAKSIPVLFNNWAVLYQGKFETVHLLNEGYLKKLLKI